MYLPCSSGNLAPETGSLQTAPTTTPSGLRPVGGDPTIAAASTLQIVVIGALILVVQRIVKLRVMI